jgi:hypothetical protein
MTFARLIAPGLLLAACLGTLPALAEDPGAAQDAKAAAKALFDRGIDERDAHRYESACPALAESYELDPRPGTLLYLAECEGTSPPPWRATTSTWRSLRR